MRIGKSRRASAFLQFSFNVSQAFTHRGGRMEGNRWIIITLPPPGALIKIDWRCWQCFQRAPFSAFLPSFIQKACSLLINFSAQDGSVCSSPTNSNWSSRYYWRHMSSSWLTTAASLREIRVLSKVFTGFEVFDRLNVRQDQSSPTIRQWMNPFKIWFHNALMRQEAPCLFPCGYRAWLYLCPGAAGQL